MKVTVLIGEPAVGKSRIMMRLMTRMGNWMFETPKYIPHHLHVKNGTMIGVIGRYDDRTHEFPGTDRMSMAAQPHVIDFLRKRMDLFDAVFFEGDRLGNDKMLNALHTMSNIDLAVVCIKTTLDRKRASQSNAFRSSRRTKIQNMTAPHGFAARKGLDVRTFVNDTPEDLESIVQHLMDTRL